ncbi:glycosyltransferase family 2 protein [Halomonas ramblicola]|uniref:glycosyltransferase family 2 protein n=1 Tax=Halomonas ramblicola TaxID=747349 RepID=UPI0025B36CC0|nr:glycosyltransferase family 2 protein [Halomonas ramblicola]MDN3522078.1 glycosyltransferase family 2 protein [Halomonas ramblicola]
MYVSVVTPAYNAEACLRLTIASVGKQAGWVREQIIIDDGSSDGTAELVQELQRDFPWVKYQYQSHLGASAARNLGIEAATGRYIAFLDSDDIWLPGKLEAQVGFMQREGGTLSYGDYERRDRESGTTLGTYVSPERVSYHDLLHGCPVGCLTAAYDQHALGKVYMPDVKRGQDWGLWLALTRLGGPARKYPGVHAVYHTGGVSLSANKLAKVRDVYRIYRDQEGFGHFRSSWYLLHHAASALRNS